MKFKKLTILLLSFFVTGLICVFDIGVKADNPSARKSVGYSYNVVTSDYAAAEGIKVGAPILDETWLAGISLNRVDYNESTTRMFSGLSFSEINAEIEADYKMKMSADADLKLFSASAKTGFELGASFAYHNYASQYFCASITDIQRYSLSLPAFEVDIDQYINHLHPIFITNLGKLYNNQMTYKAFFDLYGTHMLASVIFGGRVEVYTSIVTNEQAFNASIQTNLNNEVSTGINGIGGISSSISFDLRASLGLSTGNSQTSFYSSSRGGIPFGITNMNTYEANYAAWYQSFADDNQAVIVNYGTNGLVPLWDLLPSQYSSIRNAMISAFMAYANNYTFDLTTFDYTGGHICKVHGHELIKSPTTDSGYDITCVYGDYTYHHGHLMIYDIVNKYFYCTDCGWISRRSL